MAPKVADIMKELGIFANKTQFGPDSLAFLERCYDDGKDLDLQRFATDFCEQPDRKLGVIKDFWHDLQPGEVSRPTWSKDRDRIIQLLGQLFQVQIQGRRKTRSRGHALDRPDFTRWFSNGSKSIREASLKECNEYIKTHQLNLQSQVPAILLPELNHHWLREKTPWPAAALSILECFMHSNDFYITKTSMDPDPIHKMENLVNELLSRSSLDFAGGFEAIATQFKEKCLEEVISATTTLVIKGFVHESNAIAETSKGTPSPLQSVQESYKEWLNKTPVNHIRWYRNEDGEPRHSWPDHDLMTTVYGRPFKVEKKWLVHIGGGTQKEIVCTEEICKKVTSAWEKTPAKERFVENDNDIVEWASKFCCTHDCDVLDVAHIIRSWEEYFKAIPTTGQEKSANADESIGNSSNHSTTYVKSPNFAQAWREFSGTVQPVFNRIEDMRLEKFVHGSTEASTFEELWHFEEDTAKTAQSLPVKRHCPDEVLNGDIWPPRATKKQNINNGVPSSSSLEALPLPESSAGQIPPEIVASSICQCPPYTLPLRSSRLQPILMSPNTTEKSLCCARDKPQSPIIVSGGVEEQSGGMITAAYAARRYAPERPQVYLPIEKVTAQKFVDTSTETDSASFPRYYTNTHSTGLTGDEVIHLQPGHPVKMEQFAATSPAAMSVSRVSCETSFTASTDPIIPTRPELVFTIQKIIGKEVRRSEPYEGHHLTEKTMEEFFNFFNARSGIIADSLAFSFPTKDEPRTMMLTKPGEELRFNRLKLDIKEALNDALGDEQFKMEVTEPTVQYTPVKKGKGKEKA